MIKAGLIFQRGIFMNLVIGNVPPLKSSVVKGICLNTNVGMTLLLGASLKQV